MTTGQPTAGGPDELPQGSQRPRFQPDADSTDLREQLVTRPVHLNETAPDFELAPYAGQRYEAQVPDTYDIHERARAVQNVMVRAIDTACDGQMYFVAEFAQNPPVMSHEFYDICLPKFAQALPLIRLITGDESDMDVEHTWLDTALRQMAPDGLNYVPLAPFNGFFSPWLDDKDATHFCYTMTTYLPCFAAQYSRSADKLWADAMRRQADGLASVTIDRGDWAFIPMVMFTPHGPRPGDGRMPKAFEAATQVGWALQGLALCHRLTGYEPAGQLARKFCRYLMDQAEWFGADGRFLTDYPPDDVPPPDLQWAIPEFSHFHAHTICLLNMLDYAVPNDDREVLAFVARSYEWARTQGEHTVYTHLQRIPEWNLGYFPEYLYSPWHEEAESCQVAEMISIGLKLSAAGVGDYWDDVDRWIRNQFAEAQLIDTSWLHDLSCGFPASGSPDVPDAAPDQVHRATDADVIERNRGAFAGWPMPNAWLNHEPHARCRTMHCCTANSARTIYYIFEHICHHDAGRLSVNLLLNRASPWADIESHLPYCGRVDIRIKQPVELSVRIPGWVNLDDVRCTANGSDRRTGTNGRYVGLGQVQSGDVVTLSFPVSDTEKLLEIEKRFYQVTMRGADVVHIDPPGVRGPFYQRDHYRTGQTRTRKVHRFVADETVLW